MTEMTQSLELVGTVPTKYGSPPVTVFLSESPASRLTVILKVVLASPTAGAGRAVGSFNFPEFISVFHVEKHRPKYSLNPINPLQNLTQANIRIHHHLLRSPPLRLHLINQYYEIQSGLHSHD